MNGHNTLWVINLCPCDPPGWKDRLAMNQLAGTSIHRQVFHLAPRIIFKFPEPSSMEKHRENGMFANMIFSGGLRAGKNRW
jgi:hypothetical protein